MSYPLRKTADNVFSFTTDSGRIYNLALQITSGYISMPEVESTVLSMSLYPQGNTIIDSHDPKIMRTVSNFINDTMTQNPSIIFTWVCYSTDQKHAARHRYFNRIYKKTDNTKIDKLDYIIPDGDTNQLLSCLIHKTNPHYNKAVKAINELIEQVKQGKQ